jgi:SNF2 family DNA or RNA helicase
MKTYGELKLSKDGKNWRIECEPHVVMRLKRVFPRVSRKQHGTISISNTIETSRELEWFLQRFPMVLSDSDRGRLTGESAKHKDRETLVFDLISGVRKGGDYKLALQPREYQRVAADVAFAQGGLLLADDLGLGKTCSGICLLSKAECRPALVVTMTHLTTQWEREIRKFAPGLVTHVLRKGTPYDLRATKRHKPGQLLLTPETPDVIICNYHKLSGWTSTLKGLVRTVIYDEAQELRRDESAKYAAAKAISAEAAYRMGLTATPIYNYGDELFSVLECVIPGRLGARSEFIEEWCKQANAKSYSLQDPKAFGTYARDAGIMLQRTRAEVGRELPSLTKIPHTVETNAKVLESIEGPAAELARIILAEGESERGAKMHASDELSGLVRQATGIAKAPYVAAFVRLLVESGEQVVLYGWHRAVYDLWMEQLKDLSPVLYTGSESPTQKDAAKAKFLAGDAKILVMSLRAGAGLDGLQACCSTVVFGELDWSPGVHEQDVGRVHRDGQKKPVFAYFLIAEEGSDPIVSDVLGLKKAQADGVMDPKGQKLENLDVGGINVKALAHRYAGKAVAA